MSPRETTRRAWTERVRTVVLSPDSPRFLVAKCRDAKVTKYWPASRTLIIALAAPRAVLFMTGDQDGGSPVEGVKTLAAKVAPVYQLAGKSMNFESIIYPDTGHVYLPEMWERTVKWMDANVKASR